MCVLRITSLTRSFKAVAGRTSLPVCKVYDVGERRGPQRVWPDNGIRFVVSDRGWEDFEGQVEDALRFLDSYSSALAKLMLEHEADSASLDFPIESRLGGEVFLHSSYLPAELVRAAAVLGLGIELSYYAAAAADDDDDDDDDVAT